MGSQKTILGFILGLIVVLGVGYYIYNDSKDSYIDDEDDTASTTPLGLTGDKIEDAEIEVLPLGDDAPPIPDLNGKVLFTETFSEEVIQIFKDNIEETRSLLRADNNFFNAWIHLGTQYKAVGDYDKTIEAWNYASLLSPTNSVSFQNLGDLYGYYLKDSQKGEENLLKAISNSPNDIYLYFKTADFYKDVLKDEVKRRGIVERGLEANPNSQELKDLLKSL
jgi:tetratricopeptide (TPR) repeat protein